MALKFLNKKGWHTGSLRNIERVWKAEQKHDGEQKKLEELRKQIQDEREKSEFRLMQEQAGLVPKQERLEFLYDSGLQVGKVAQADEYLLGKPVEEAVQPESDVGQVAAKPGALFVEEKPVSANDSWRKLHSDPLFLIKQQEQAAISRITSNPVKMAEIKKAAEMKRKLKEEKKKKRKEAKRERKEKRKRQKKHVSSSEDSSDSDDPREKRKRRHNSDADGDAGQKEKRVQVKSRNMSRSPVRSPVRNDRRQSPRKSRGEVRELETERRVPSKSNSRSSLPRDHDRGRSGRDGNGSRGSFKLEGRQRERKGSDQAFEDQMKRDLSRSPSSSAIRSPDRRDLDRDKLRRDGYDSRGTFNFEGRQREHNDGGFEGRTSEQRKRAPSRSPSRSASRSPVRRDRHQRSKGSGSRDYEKRNRFPSRSPLRSRSRSPVRRSDERLKRPEDLDFDKGKRAMSPSKSRSKSPGQRRYGLISAKRDDLDSRGEIKHRERITSDHRLKELDGEDSRPLDSRELERGLKSSSNGYSRDTERHAELPVARKEEMNGFSSRPGHKGRPPKPQLSDAERATRLAEMQANADVHEEQRWQRLKRAADADDVEAKRTVKDKSNEEFLADTQKSIFGAERSSASTIEKSVKRRAHFIERSSADNERNAFRR